VSDLKRFQQELLKSADARKEFASNPAAYLNKHNIHIPAGTKLPKSIPVEELEKTVGAINENLKTKGVDITKLDAGDAASVSKFVGEATFQPVDRQAYLDKIKTVVDQYNSRISAGRNPGDAATALVIGAVVAAVVATPVKVYSVDLDVEDEI